MPVLSFEDILQQIEKRSFQPVYFLYGEEGFFIDEVTKMIIENALPEAEQSFNQTIMYGADVELADIVMAARRFPMMAEKQVVVVKEAQEIDGINGAAGPGKKDNVLSLYLEKPMETTILVIACRQRKLDKRTKFYKSLNKNAVILESKPLYDRELYAWIRKYVKDKGFEIVDNAVQLLGTYLGNNLEKLVNELNKLAVVLPEKATITPVHVEENVGISKDYNVFELWDAVATKNVTKANQIAVYFSKNSKDHHIAVTIAVLFDNFVKLLAAHNLRQKGLGTKEWQRQLNLNYFQGKTMDTALRKYNVRNVVNIIKALRNFDAASKGVGAITSDSGELTKELVSTILYYN